MSAPCMRSTRAMPGCSSWTAAWRRVMPSEHVLALMRTPRASIIRTHSGLTTGAPRVCSSSASSSVSVSLPFAKPSHADHRGMKSTRSTPSGHGITASGPVCGSCSTPEALAPRSSNNRTTSGRPSRQAAWSGSQYWLLWYGLAPRSSSTRTTSTWPKLLATQIGNIVLAMISSRGKSRNRAAAAASPASHARTSFSSRCSRASSSAASCASVRRKKS
mmetsp:Transcript_2509/g.7609  ORF Transcript_2509/g.7609 Transcript_2509/m.7609 type:complete len:218 (+) Transcript_2509:246-899(+)